MTNQIYSYSYSRAYSPPMPVVEIGLNVPGRTQGEILLTALIDSGSDGTMIPLDVLKSLKARYVDQARVRSILGDTQLVNLYLVSLRIGIYQVHATQVIATTQTDEIILGRNVLNQLVITLNGLASVTEIVA